MLTHSDSPQLVPPYQSLTRSVIFQQLSGKAAETILGRFLALFPGRPFPEPEQVLDTDIERLRAAGLSRPKARYLHEIATHTVAGRVPDVDECDGLSDADLVERLTAIKGVGRWTVEMLLIFNLGRPDVLPVLDLGVRRGFQLAYRRRQMPTPDALERFGQRWRPHRSTAALYLWRAVDGDADGGW